MKREIKDVEATLFPNKQLDIWKFKIPLFNYPLAGGEIEIERYNDNTAILKCVCKGFKLPLGTQVTVYLNDSEMLSFTTTYSESIDYRLSSVEGSKVPDANPGDKVLLHANGYEIFSGIFQKD